MAILADLYCRVSLELQAEEGYSLQEQEERLRAYAKAQGWTIHAVRVDPGFSGASMDRPGLQAVLDDVRAHRIQKVCTYKLDRLSRSQKDTLYLIEDCFIPNGVDYVSATEPLDTGTPLGMAMVGILSVFAQLERQQIKERMTMGRIASAKEGNWRGGSGVPIGYRYQPRTATEPGRLVVDEYEAAQIREVFRRFLAGETFHAIMDHMQAAGYTTAYGKFAAGGASRIPAILENRAYIGDIKYMGQWYPGKHDPIIDRVTFQRAQDKLAEYRAALDAHRRQPYQAGHLLTGLLFCGECGARWAFHTCSYKAKDGSRRHYDTYTCYTRNAHKTQRRAERCSLQPWNAAELEELVWSQVLALRLEDVTAGNAPEDRAAPLRKRLAALDAQVERLVDLYALGTVPMETIQRRSAQIAQEREKLTAAIDAAERGSGRPSAAELGEALRRAPAVRESGTVVEQRALLAVLIRKITLDADRRVRIEWNI